MVRADTNHSNRVYQLKFNAPIDAPGYCAALCCLMRGHTALSVILEIWGAKILGSAGGRTPTDPQSIDRGYFWRAK